MIEPHGVLLLVFYRGRHVDEVSLWGKFQAAPSPQSEE